MTQSLPGDLVIGCDISEQAIAWAQKRAADLTDKKIRFFARSIFDLHTLNLEPFDLVLITGVLYSQYIADSSSFVHLVFGQLLKKGGILVTCHIQQWYICPFPYMLLDKHLYAYREYTHALEVFQK